MAIINLLNTAKCQVISEMSSSFSEVKLISDVKIIFRKIKLMNDIC